MKRNIILLTLAVLIGQLSSQSLFQVKDANDKPVLNVTGNGLIILNPNTTTDTWDDTLMIITNAQMKAFVEDYTGNKGLARSFEVVSSNSSKGMQYSLFNLTKDNYFIGHESGTLTTGTKNTFFGYMSGKANTTGASNIFIGNETGLANVAGLRNIFIGNQAGYANVGNASSGTIGHDNIYIGTSAGKSNQVGEHNTMIGSYNGYNGTGNRNTFIGAFNGFNATGANNTTLGVDAGRNLVSGAENTYIGAGAASNEGVSGPGVGSRNVFLGYCSGFNNLGSDNIFLGYRAGQSETGSGKLYIENSSSTSPLIYGDFTNNLLKFNANVGINYNGVSGYGLIVDTPSGQTETYALYVMGNAYSTGTWSTSDERYKKDIRMISSPTEKLKQLRGVTYNWKQENQNDLNFDQQTQYGFIAQEVEMILPELVKEDHRGYKALNYNGFIPIITETIKEQSTEIENLKRENKALHAEIEEIKRMLKK